MPPLPYGEGSGERPELCKVHITNFMIIGQYIHQIDPKKRLSLPSRWRSEVGSKLIITNGLDKSLYIYTVTEWEMIAEKLSSLGFATAEIRNFTRFMLANAYEIEIDSAGRILIPDNLKKFANLNNKVVLIGMHKRIEVWGEEEWEIYSKNGEIEVETTANKLSELGIL